MLAGEAQHVNEKGAGKQVFNAEKLQESRTVYKRAHAFAGPVCTR
jgi:hypothetical protein